MRDRHHHFVERGHRVTTLELFFDLVFVYAITQVTALLTRHPTPAGLLQGVLVLLVLWWCWCSYAWLATTVRADAGSNRVVLLAAMSVMFVIALTIPVSFTTAPGGLDGPLLFAGCYLAVRLLHVGAYALAGRGDRALRSVVRRTAVLMLTGTALLTAAAFTGGGWQLLLWSAALAIDYVGVFLNGQGGWRLESPAHFAERHGLIVIVALGESIVAIGIGIADRPVTPLVLVAALGGLVLSGSLWWMYFTGTADRSEAALERAVGRARTALARDGYTFLHLPMVAGVVLLAVGLKKTMVAVSDPATGGVALHGVALWATTAGIALFVGALVAFRHRTTGSWDLVRAALAALALAVTPLLERVPAAAAIGVLAAGTAAVVAFQTIRGRAPEEAAEEPVPEYLD